MFDRFQTLALRVLNIPPEPRPPSGAPGSLRVFRAGRRHFHLRVARWALGQTGAAAGIAISIAFFAVVKQEVEALRHSPPPAPGSEVTPALKNQSLEWRKVARDRFPPAQAARNLARVLPPWALPVIIFFEAGGVLLFLAQLPFTFALVRLEFRQHWYMVTDRSLRIRTGLVRLQESTMSFANLQQVEVRQGPLQRLLGLWDVRVRSAGGGGDHTEENGTADLLHMGVLQGVDNGPEVRDLILERLRLFREAGLGDPDDAPSPAGPASDPRLEAARLLAAEAAAMRRAVSPLSDPRV